MRIDADAVPTAAGHGPDGARAEGDGLSPGEALMLQAWLSPSFPVGAFAYSHGLEWAVEDGSVIDLSSLAAWLGGVLAHGGGRSDAILAAHVHRAVAAGDDAALLAAAELAAALLPTRERRLESLAQGEAFLKAVRETWPHPAIERAAGAIEAAGHRVAYPVAVGLAAAAHGLPLAGTLAGFLHGFVANLASAAVRLVPLGQTDGQRAVAALHPAILAVAAEAATAGLDDVGGAALRADIASARHETQYTRLFRT